MKSRHISEFLFSFFFFVLCFFANAQEKSKSDTVMKSYPQRYGVRFGVDLFKLSRGFYDKNYQGIELVGDYRLTKKHFFAAEIGLENKTVQEDNLNFTTKGSYIKAGFDYNVHENWLDLENMIYVGMRYGFSTFSQQLNSYKIYNSSTYFGQSQLINANTNFDGLSAQWVEIVAGLKTRVFDNVFVGFSFRGNFLVSNKKPNDFDNLYIPGFNRTYGGTFGVGFNYTVSYLLPLYKKKTKTKKA
jgi:hypothetical protein